MTLLTNIKNNTRTTLVFLLFLSLAQLSLLNGAAAQSNDGLFRYVGEQDFAPDTPPGRLLQNVKNRPSATQVRIARLPDASALSKRESVLLNFGPSKRFTATLQKVKQRDAGDFSWIGQLPESGHVLLVVNGENVTGLIRAGGTTYTVEPLGQGLHAIAQVDYSQFPPDEPSDFMEQQRKHDRSANGTGGDESNAKTGITGSSVTALSQGTPVIDALVVYTSAAANASGDIDGLINGAIDASNKTLNDSNAPASVNLAYKEQISYTESGSFLTDVTRLRGTTDGFMDKYLFSDSVRGVLS
jgi:hypothetical protein